MQTKILIYFSLAILIGVGINRGTRYYHKEYGIYATYDVSDYLSVVEFNNGKCLIKNESTENIVGEKYDHVFNTFRWDGDVVVVVKDGLRGYISAETGEILVEPQYQRAWINGGDTYLAACIDTAGKLGFIDVRNGKTVIQHKFDCYIVENPYFEYIFRDNLCIIKNEDLKCGIIDTLGNIVLPMLYDEVEYGMNNGFIRVSNDDYTGLLDYETKNIVIPIEYDDIHFDYSFDYDDESEYEEEDDEYEEEKEYRLKVKKIIAHRNDSTFLFGRDLKQKMILAGEWQHVEKLDNGYIKAYNYGGNTCIFDNKGNKIYAFYEGI
ncbi:MAG: WG repeat-containing protein [Bacteroidales bacterium]|jgi:hypothetical protein|nr:WG repeat-containing protein [Bacteroidales bacterium]